MEELAQMIEHRYSATSDKQKERFLSDSNFKNSSGVELKVSISNQPSNQSTHDLRFIVMIVSMNASVMSKLSLSKLFGSPSLVWLWFEGRKKSLK